MQQDGPEIDRKSTGSTGESANQNQGELPMTRHLTRRPNRLAYREPFFRNMDRLFDEFVRPTMTFDWEREDLGERAWMPSVDIAETETEYQLLAELPGLTKTDVDITVENGVLTLKGERSFEEKKEGKNFHRIERAYGAFSRAFVLPTEVDGEHVKATFQDGLLSIVVPKAERAKPRKIEIG